jgi:hypothetical protein
MVAASVPSRNLLKARLPSLNARTVGCCLCTVWYVAKGESPTLLNNPASRVKYAVLRRSAEVAHHSNPRGIITVAVLWHDDTLPSPTRWPHPFKPAARFPIV